MTKHETETQYPKKVTVTWQNVHGDTVELTDWPACQPGDIRAYQQAARLGLVTTSPPRAIFQAIVHRAAVFTDAEYLAAFEAMISAGHSAGPADVIRRVMLVTAVPVGQS